MNWETLNDISKVFKAKKFKDIDESLEEILISLSDESRTFLKIIIVDDDFDKHTKELGVDIRYLLLIKNFHEFHFVKTDFSPMGKERKLKFKFSKDYIKNSTLEKLNSLEYGNINSFDNIFDTKAVVKEFYRQYKEKLDNLTKAIKNIDDKQDQERYAQVLFDRLIFLHFIQTKRFLSEQSDYLLEKLLSVDAQKKNYYDEFLKFLFFEVLNKRPQERKTLKHTEFSDIPFLNGGLFREHRIESENPTIWIGNDAFKEVLSFLSEWIWYVDETADFGDEKTLSPEILGHIFEKTITNQKDKGAFYTPSEVTNYIAENTILRFCISKVNEKFSIKYSDIQDIFKNKQHTQYLYFFIIKNLTILEHACGSGAFLLAAQKLLFDLYVSAWEVISNSKNQEVLDELKQISKFKTPNYYFKRSIITNNIYGVDVEEGAIEICKLRLWLSLVSEIEKENAEPLPNIDYNIIMGNSLIGYITNPKIEQKTLDDQTDVKIILSEIDRLKKDFVNEEDPGAAKTLQKTIDGKIESYNLILNRKLVAEFFEYGLHLSHTDIAKMNPLHYRLKFSTVFSEHNGFDIIIGNPPYVERNKIGYPTSFFKTDKCGNSYAYFFERAVNLIKNSGRVGFIVPISSIGSDRMIPMQNLLINNSTELRISNFDDRPGKIFEGLEHCRSSIIIAAIEHGHVNDDNIWTTKYNRWYSRDRKQLFGNLDYVESSDVVQPGIIPKIGTTLELDLLKRIQKEPKMSKYFVKDSNHKVWYHNAPQYWIRAMNFVPKFENKNTNVSSHVKVLSVEGVDKANLMLAILNSSLFYWFFITTSNCRDLTLREIGNFGINLEKMSDNNAKKLLSLTDKLMISYKKNSIIKKTNYEKTGAVVYQEFYPKKSKLIIDDIDNVLADHYSLSSIQKEFIKKFDEKFRMGEDED